MSDEQGYPAGCGRCKALEDALRRLVEAVEREYGEQPDVPELQAAKALLK